MIAFAIPAAVTGLIANARAIALHGRPPDFAEIQKAAQAQTFEIERPGRTVLIGEIPRGEGGGQAQEGCAGRRQEFPGVHDPRGVEALLQGAQGLDPDLPTSAGMYGAWSRPTA